MSDYVAKLIIVSPSNPLSLAFIHFICLKTGVFIPNVNGITTKNTFDEVSLSFFFFLFAKLNALARIKALKREIAYFYPLEVAKERTDNRTVACAE